MFSTTAVARVGTGLRTWVVIIVSATVVIAGCQSSAAPNSAPPSTAASTAAQPSAAAQAPSATPCEAVTLKVQDGQTDPGPDSAAQAVYANFEAANPCIKIDRTVLGADARIATTKANLTAGTGPDVFQYDNGEGNIGIIARAGLLMPLSDIPGLDPEKLNSPAALQQSTYAGKAYGIGWASDILGLYWNQSLIEKNGLQTPKTDTELLQFCKDAKAKGLIPIAFTNNPGWQSFHQLAMIANNAMGTDLSNLLFNNVGSWTDPRLVAAVKLYFIDMVQAGCYPKSVNAVDYDTGTSDFVSGKALGLPTGTWIIGDITKGLPNSTLTLEMFPSIAGAPQVLPEAVVTGWFVSAKTQHPEAAGMLLTYLASPEANKIFAEKGSLLPTGPVSVEGLNVSPLQLNAIKVAQAGAVATPSQPIGPWIDTIVSADFQSTMQSGFQSVVAGKTTPEKQMSDLQKDWEAGWAATHP
jgi:raffinose/stachyose/melibiose transport system substrate-binding protein